MYSLSRESTWMCNISICNLGSYKLFNFTKFFSCLNLNQAMQLNENVIFLKCDVTMFHMASCRILIAISQSLLVCMLHYITIYLVIQNRNSTAEALSCRSLGESETLCKFYTVRCFEFSQTFMSGFTVDL